MNFFTQVFGGSDFRSILNTITLLISIVSAILLINRRQLIRENMKSIGAAFKETVAGLSSKNLEVRMSSAILLRRFLIKKSEFGVGGAPFAQATVSVISALLKSKQTSEIQKVLADTLRFAPKGALVKADFQRANLSKAYMGGKDVIMEEADFFQANLTGTHLKEAVLNRAVFYEATLNKTKFQKCKLEKADFKSAILQDVDFTDADLRGASFENARLRDVIFTRAKIDGINTTNAMGQGITDGPSFAPPDSTHALPSNKIFISRIGVLDARQKLIVDSLKDILTKFGVAHLELSRDMYDATNILSNLSSKIDSCSAMIVFGFRSIHVIEGIFRYNTEDSRHVQNEFLSTPWNHIEIGMAVMKAKPVLMIVEDKINDGAFHDVINDELLTKISMDCCLDDKKENILSWLKKSSRCLSLEPTTPAS